VKNRLERLLHGGDLTWVCGACGKTAAKREDFRDVSCVMRAVLCWTASLNMDGKGRATEATAVTTAERAELEK
jgi:hypothetical protein